MLKRSIEIIIGSTFLVSAITKLTDFNNTVNFIISITGTNYSTVKTGLVFLSLLEIAIGISFFVKVWTKSYLFYTITGLLLLFILLNIYLMVQGYSNCGCFGTQIVSSPFASLVKNALIILFMIYFYYYPGKQKLRINEQ